MRLYRFLLHLYPASFRAEYGDEMCAVFAQRGRETNFLVLWLETLIDLFSNALRVHLDMLRQDLRYAARTLRAAPGFALTAMAVAALGIGATTAAFTMVDHVLIRPLPFPDPDRLVRVWESPPGYRYNELSPANYRDLKRISTCFETFGSFRGLSASMVGEGEPRQINGAVMTAEIFPMLGIQPALGRFFTEEDDRETAPGTLVLSFALWQSAFGGGPSVLGRKVALDGAPYTIIGVMPRDFFFPNRETQLWTAMRFGPSDFQDRANNYIHGLARLKRGVSLSKAGAEMQVAAAQIDITDPKEMAGTGFTVERLRDSVGPQARTALYVLLAAAVCVLLVACANLGNLLLARALARRPELAIRAAMGAGRERLLRQMFTESLLLAVLGGVLGVSLAYGTLPLLVQLVPTQLPIAEIPPIDSPVLLFAAAATCATAILFGLIPVLRVVGGNDSAGLHEGSRSGVGGRKERLRATLVVAEICGSVVLLATCGLLIRALWRIQSVDPGFRSENVLTLRTSLPMPKYQRTGARVNFYNQVISEARRLPGVTSVAYTSFLPMVMRGGIWPVDVEGHPQPVSERQHASLRFVTPGFLSAMGVPMIAGRDVAESDTPDTLYVAVVSESFAHSYWPNESALGHRFNFGLHERTIVGVAGNVRVRGLERSSEPQVYLPYRQVPDGWLVWYAPKDLIVRATLDPLTLAPALRRIIHQADPEQPVSDVQTLSDIVAGETETRKVQATALAAFALIAFLLAGIGIHGLLAFAVSSRTQEIGVRMALGASSANILRMIVGEALLLAAAGVFAGTAAAYGAGHGLESLLAGVNPTDPATLVSAALLCLTMAVAGSLIPAIRATRLDAAKAIRSET